ncbi:unnamed protein product, partial [Bubo scandiacus]
AASPTYRGLAPAPRRASLRTPRGSSSALPPGTDDRSGAAAPPLTDGETPRSGSRGGSALAAAPGRALGGTRRRAPPRRRPRTLRR